MTPLTALFLTAALPDVLPGQSTPDSLAADSLRARVEQLEDAVRLLRQRMEAQAAAEVRTRSRARLEISGRLAGTGFYATDRVNNLDVPQLVTAGAEAPGGDGALGATFRQSLLGLALSGLRAGGAEVEADLDLDFAGGAQAGAGGRGTFPTPRLRTARAFLRAGGHEVMVGHDVPLVLGENPVSVASVATPLFANAGNLWLWLTQARYTRELGGADAAVRLALQGAVLAPNAGEPAVPDPGAVDLGERSRRPFLQARARVRWGGEDAEGEIGVGVHRGWLRRPTGELVGGGAAAVDLRVPLGPVELRGEAYRGRLLRGLGGGGIGQNFGLPRPDGADGSLPGHPIRDAGGWAQLVARAGEPWLAAAGCGVDDPENDDLPPLRRRNVACAGSLTWRPGGGWLVGAEAKRLGTEYAGGTRWASHGAVVLGVEF